MQQSLISFSEPESRNQPLLKLILTCFRNNAQRSLREIYDTVAALRPGTKESTVRGRLNENNGKLFRRIARGVYIAIQGTATALILEGDAWEKITEIETESLDAMFADPAYPWLNHHIETGTTRKKDGHLSYETRELDATILKEMFRVLKSKKEGTGINNQRITGGAHLFIFIPALTDDTWEHVDALIKDAKKVGFAFNKLIIWDKISIGMGYNGRNRYEGILFMSKGERVIPFDFSIPDVLTVKRTDPTTRIHESEKPAELYEPLIKFSTQAGDVILDLFAGSANSARAALALGRNIVLFEKKQEFIDNISTG
ncbi:MAG: site-specific DNA-methyltransferase [Candidatus Methanoperedens sp.]